MNTMAKVHQMLFLLSVFGQHTIMSKTQPEHRCYLRCTVCSAAVVYVMKLTSNHNVGRIRITRTISLFIRLCSDHTGTAVSAN